MIDIRNAETWTWNYRKLSTSGVNEPNIISDFFLRHCFCFKVLRPSKHFVFSGGFQSHVLPINEAEDLSGQYTCGFSFHASWQTRGSSWLPPWLFLSPLCVLFLYRPSSTLCLHYSTTLTWHSLYWVFASHIDFPNSVLVVTDLYVARLWILSVHFKDEEN